MDRDDKARDYCVRTFGIKPEEFVWHHSGICYSRIGVNTKEAAEKVRAKVKGETVNGGYLHGMPLGGYDKPNENGTYDIKC